MCTVIILKRPGHDWPLLVGANRDEMQGRPWLLPARHWPDRPEVTAGIDQLAGGSWLGLNDQGVMAAMLNRMGTLGPQDGKRSRGELVLDALDFADAADAAASLSYLDANAYRPFNMLIADNRDAVWLRNDGRTVKAQTIPDGLSILTAFELNDERDARIRHFRPLFQSAPPPDPEQSDWAAWQTLLSTSAPHGLLDRESGLCFQLDNGFGTRSSALLALPSMARQGIAPVFLFAAGPPGQAGYLPVTG